LNGLDLRSRPQRINRFELLIRSSEDLVIPIN
jgi:hypothetical protein